MLAAADTVQVASTWRPCTAAPASRPRALLCVTVDRQPQVSHTVRAGGMRRRAGEACAPRGGRGGSSDGGEPHPPTGEGTPPDRGPKSILRGVGRVPDDVRNKQAGATLPHSRHDERGRAERRRLERARCQRRARSGAGSGRLPTRLLGAHAAEIGWL